MPNRVVREGFLDSDRINKMDFGSQVFFIRLMLIVDDYGRFDGRVPVIKSKAYPLDNQTQENVSKWLSTVCQEGLVRLYEVDGKQYLFINEFNQRLRKMKSKWPVPPDSNMPQSDVNAPQTVVPNPNSFSRGSSQPRN